RSTLREPGIAGGRGFGRQHSVARAWSRRHDRYRPPRILSVAATGLGLLDSQVVQCRLPSRRHRAKHCARKPRAAYLARARGGRPGRGDHSVDPANGSPHIENRPCNPSAQAASGTVCHSVGQAAPYGALCRKLLRGARRIHAADPPDHAAIERRVGSHAETTSCPETTRRSKFHAAAVVGAITLFASVIFVAGKTLVSACLRIIASSLAALPPHIR